MLGVQNIPAASTFEKPSFVRSGFPVHKETDKRNTTTFKHIGIKGKKKEKRSEMSDN